MNQNQKGFVNIVLVVLVVVLAGVAGYFALVKTTPVTQQTTPPTTTTPSLASATSTASTTPATVQDCGSVIGAHFSNPQAALEEASITEKTSFTCMGRAFVSCYPATITVTGTGGDGSYKINGKNGSYCSITQKATTPFSTKTCKIPMDWIADRSLSVKIGSIFILAPLIMYGNGPVINTQTGEEVTIECNSV